MSVPKLLFCPFCKHAAIMRFWPREVDDNGNVIHYWYQAQCTNLICLVTLPPVETEAAAIKQWNTRAK